MASRTVDYGATIAEPNITRTGYTFAGWYTDEECTDVYNFANSVVEDMTLYASWTINSYNATFMSEGIQYNQVEVEYKAKVTKPEDPTKAGHTFDGWYDENGNAWNFTLNTMPANDMTLYAQWSVIKYTVTFKQNDSSDDTYTSVDADFDTTFNEPKEPTRTGYTFGGWYVDEECTEAYDFTAEVTSDVTLYAKWLINKYTVAFNVDGGSEVGNQTVSYNKNVMEPLAPIKEGYIFQGWFDDETLEHSYDFTSPVTADMTLYAKWKAVPESNNNVIIIVVGVASASVAAAAAIGCVVAIQMKKRRKL